MIYIIPIFAILSVLFGLKRRALGDILNFISILISLVISFIGIQKYNDKISELILSRVQLSLPDTPFLKTLITISFKPLCFTVAFIIIVSILKIVFSIVSLVGKKDQKLNIIKKIILNGFCGLVIGYILLLPFSFYPQKTDQLISLLDQLNQKYPSIIKLASNYQVDEKLYSPINSVLTKVTFGSYTYSFDQCYDAIIQASSLSSSLSSDSIPNLIESLKKDESLDVLYGYVFQETISSTNQSLPTTYKKAFAMYGKLSSKLQAIHTLDLVGEMLSSSVDCKEALNTLISINNESVYEILGSICDYDYVKMIDSILSKNAPLIQAIIRSMSILTDCSEQSVQREAESISYIMNLKKNSNHSFDYNSLDDKMVAKCINQSEILQQAYILVTENGTILDPCKMYDAIYPSHYSTIIYELEHTYGYSQQSDLYRSMLAYFGVKKI